MARETFIDDLDSSMSILTVSLIRMASEDRTISEVIERWSEENHILVERWRSMISEIQGAVRTDFAMFSVALRELMDLALASQNFMLFENKSVECVAAA